MELTYYRGCSLSKEEEEWVFCGTEKNRIKYREVCADMACLYTIHTFLISHLFFCIITEKLFVAKTVGKPEKKKNIFFLRKNRPRSQGCCPWWYVRLARRQNGLLTLAWTTVIEKQNSNVIFGMHLIRTKTRRSEDNLRPYYFCYVCSISSYRSGLHYSISFLFFF